MKLFLFLNFVIFIFGFSTECSPTNASKSNQKKTEASPAASPTPTAPPIAQADKNVIWRGTSADFEISWTKDDISAKKISDGATVFSARKLAGERLKKSSGNSARNGKANFEKFYFQYKILSVAGSLLFLQESTSYSPQSYTQPTFLAIDLSNPKSNLSLTKFYSKAEILNALVKNPQVSEDLKANDIPAPKNFNEFFKAYDREPTEVADRQIDKCSFPKTVFESFAFDRIENEKVVVDLGVPCRAGMREDVVYPLELVLPIKDSLKIADKQIHPSSEFKSIGEDEETIIQFDEKSLSKSK